MTARYQEIQSKVVCTLEGGYNLQWIGKCLVTQLGQMTNNLVDFGDSTEENVNVDDLIKNLKNEIGSYWDI